MLINNIKTSHPCTDGVAILGYRAGDEIEWEVPSGKRKIRIEEIIYQPEAEGNYYL